ncbi:g5113 [Coccomyxa elongata]
MSVLQRAGRLLLFCLAGILLEHVQAHPPARLLIDNPAPAAAPEVPPEVGHKHQDPSKQHSRKFGVGSAIGGLLGALKAADADTDGSKKDAAQEATASTGVHHRAEQASGPSAADPQHNPSDRWVHKAPHLPPAALEKALFNAAFNDGASGLHTSTGMVIATTGNRFNFAKLLQKFLAGLKHSLSGDMTNHAVIVGMGKGAKSICEGLNGRYSHQCVHSTNWPGHDTEYNAGDAWHLAAELHKLELILNILTLGYSVAYVDVDTMFFRNPMPFLLSSQADIALPDNTCRAASDNAMATPETKFDQDTSLIFARSGPRAVRLISDWISLHKHDLHRQDGLIRHDQVVFNDVLAPHFLRDGGNAFVRIQSLSQDRFPSWCSGPCGCAGASKVAPVMFKKEEDPSEGVRSGVLECPEPTVTQWFTFHYACTKSGAEKESLMDISLALLEDVRPIDMSIVTGV